MSNHIAVFLCRSEYGPDRYYGEARVIPASADRTIMGVAVREPNNTIDGAEMVDEFIANVEDTAEAYRWFDSDLDT